MTARPAADRCPGLLRAFPAADGALVRLRQPGGTLRLSRLSGLLELAERWGGPFLHLTSRSNLQVRGLPDPLPVEFVDGVAELGLLPSPTHERVRNIVASPWSRHAEEVGAIVAELDGRLVADPELAGLPGRFLLVVDDGSRELLGLPYDFGLLRVGPGRWQVRSAGPGTAAPEVATSDRVTPGSVGAGEAVDLVLAGARSFLRSNRRSARPVWQLGELSGADPLFAEALFAGFATDATPPAPPPEAGWRAGDLVVTVPLGRLCREHVAAFHSVVEDPQEAELVLTPWRQLVLPRAPRDAPSVLSRASLVCGPGSGWDGLTACVGAPYCRRTDLDTAEVARTIALRNRLSEHHSGGSGGRIHVSGCERRCGAPSSGHVEQIGPIDLSQAQAWSGPTDRSPSPRKQR